MHGCSWRLFKPKLNKTSKLPKKVIVIWVRAYPTSCLCKLLINNISYGSGKPHFPSDKWCCFMVIIQDITYAADDEVCSFVRDTPPIWTPPVDVPHRKTTVGKALGGVHINYVQNNTATLEIHRNSLFFFTLPNRNFVIITVPQHYIIVL